MLNKLSVAVLTGKYHILVHKQRGPACTIPPPTPLPTHWLYLGKTDWHFLVLIGNGVTFEWQYLKVNYYSHFTHMNEYQG